MKTLRFISLGLFAVLLGFAMVSFKKNFRCGVEKSATENRTFSVGGVEFTMVYVEGGTFMMGNNDADSCDSEKPVHHVTLSDYYIGETEVTQALWQAVMGTNPSWVKGDNLPVECVSWADCQNFIGKLNQITGENFSLPTEAQWEFAARGGNYSKGYKYSGSNDIDAVAWCWINSAEFTHLVATKQANELGIYDMTGNVWEWCYDLFLPHSSVAVVDFPGFIYVCRGGSFKDEDFRADSGTCIDNTVICRCTSRRSGTPTETSINLGLRLALK